MRSTPCIQNPPYCFVCLRSPVSLSFVFFVRIKEKIQAPSSPPRMMIKSVRSMCVVLQIRHMYHDETRGEYFRSGFFAVDSIACQRLCVQSEKFNIFLYFNEKCRMMEKSLVTLNQETADGEMLDHFRYRNFHWAQLNSQQFDRIGNDAFKICMPNSIWYIVSAHCTTSTHFMCTDTFFLQR